MRAQAMENLLVEFEEAVDKLRGIYLEAGNYTEALFILENLAIKSAILRDRSDVSASVVRELVNK